MKKSKPINPSNPHETKTKSNPRTDLPIHHHQSTHPPPPSSDQPIKPTTDQPIHHHRVPINPSNPQLINLCTTTEFLNQTHCQSTHQTHRRSTHPPPSSSQIKKLKHQFFIRPNSMGERERKLHLVHIEERERERERCLLGME